MRESSQDRSECDRLATPTIFLTLALSVAAISAAVIGMASPPLMRIAAGCIFLLAALYFWKICPVRDNRPTWVVPLFALIGTVFSISGGRVYLPGSFHPFVDVVAGLGFIALALAMWFVVGVILLEDVPEFADCLREDDEQE